MKFDEIQEKLDDLKARIARSLDSTDVSRARVELVQVVRMLQETVTTTTKMLRELAEVQSLHNDVLETYRVKLERLEGPDEVECAHCSPGEMWFGAKCAWCGRERV